MALAMTVATGAANAQQNLDVLFLGDRGHHQPRIRYDQLVPVLAKRNIRLVYTEDMGQLSAATLGNYDALLLYANIDNIGKSQADALLKYVAEGGGFVPVHCATFCFRNNDEIVALMGAQFQRHGTGVFRTEIAQKDHPIMKGFGGFASWDETYVHHLHNEKNRIVLSYRVDDDGREPWTWIRTHGAGRVFYTAWGHDHRTWGNAGFQNLIERGIRWAAGGRLDGVPDYMLDRPFPVPEMTKLREDLKPFDFIDVGAKIPNYTPGKQWGTQGEAKSRMQKPVPAEESMQHMVTPEGFRVELFASEPDLGGKPITMAWDERGRLWVAETFDYPNELQPEGKGRDRIRILEDTDGDWKADKFTVFADKLSIPTSIAFYKGGVIVHDSTKTLYFKDTDGDDVADEKKVLIRGWNQGDTHGGVSNFQYGLDNWIWAMQGYNNSAPELQGETSQNFRQGFFRFRPDGSQLEFIRSTDNNTWGLGISEEGLIFGSTANRNPSVFMPIPNRYYERVRGWTASLRLGTIADTYLFKPITKNIRQVDQHGGYTAGAGHALYTARQFPPEYWNRTAFVNGPTGHLVGAFVLSRDGSGYQSTSPFNLLASDDEWSAPIMSEVGPDGNVWVIDWYNYIVQHNPTPHGFKTGRGNAYETDLRDKKHGRIYRVVYGDSAKPMTLAGASTEKLVATLTHPTMLWRKHAQRLLVEQGGRDAVQGLLALVADPSVDSIGLNVGAIHALWTLHGLGQLDGSNPAATAAAIGALRHPSAGVRRNAVQVLPATAAANAAILGADLLNDTDQQVKLAALLAISDRPSAPGVAAAVLRVLQESAGTGDRWLTDAAIAAAAQHAAPFLAQAASSQGGTAKLSEKALESLGVVANHYGRTGPVDTVGRLMAQLGEAPPEVADIILNGVAAGWPEDRRPELTAQTEAQMNRLMAGLKPSTQGVLVKLARSWGSKQFEEYARKVADSLLDQVDDESISIPKRIGAAEQYVEFQSDNEDAVEEVFDRISPQTDATLAKGLVQALSKSRVDGLGKQITGRLDRMTPATRSTAISVLLARSDATMDLVGAIESGNVLISELSLDQRQMLLEHPNRGVQRTARAMMARGGALPNADRQAVLERLLPLAKLEGDVALGKEAFKKNCSICHMHSGEGKKIGPDLTGMAVHPKAELLTHIIDPSRDVEGNFRVYTVQTEDGEVINGLLASESKTSIEMYDAKGEKKVVLREDIARLKSSRKSLMPEGFEKQMKEEELTNLLQFLTARGKFLPLDISKVATIPSDRGMFVSKSGGVERLIFPDWDPKTFKGVPFHLTDPKEGAVNNAILLYSATRPIPKDMPKQVTLPCNGPARAVHLLSGVSGWGFPIGETGSLTMTVRLNYADGQTEDHPLQNGVHFADYIRRHDVPRSEFAFQLRGQQMRYLAIYPKRKEPIKTIDFIKGDDESAPVVMAVTLEN